MEYRQLSPETVPGFLKDIPSVQQIFSDLDDLEVEEVGDGNLNFVYKVRQQQESGTNGSHQAGRAFLANSRRVLAIVTDSHEL